LLLAALDLKRDDRFSTDSFYSPAGKPPVLVFGDFVQIGGDQLKLERRASAVEDENIHRLDRTAVIPQHHYRGAFENR
jgi:hypothetical protein